VPLIAGGIVGRQHVDASARVDLEVVRLLRANPGGWQPARRRVTRILDPDRDRLDLRMAPEERADQMPVPLPVAFRPRCRVDAGEAAAGADIPLERGALRLVEQRPLLR